MKVVRPFKEIQSKLFLTTDLTERELLGISNVLRDLDKYKKLSFKIYELDLSDYENFEVSYIELGKHRTGHILNIILRSIISPDSFQEFGVTIDLNNTINVYKYPSI